MKVENEVISIDISEQLENNATEMVIDEGLDFKAKRKLLRKQLEQLLEQGIDLKFNIILGDFKRAFNVHYKKDNVHMDYYIDIVDRVVKYVFTQNKQDLGNCMEDSRFIDEIKVYIKSFWGKLKKLLGSASDRMNGISEYVQETAVPKLMNGASVTYGNVRVMLQKLSNAINFDYVLDCSKANTDIDKFVEDLNNQFKQKDELQIKAIHDMKQMIVKMQHSDKPVNSVDLLNVILDLTKCIATYGEPYVKEEEDFQTASNTVDTEASIEDLQETFELDEKNESNSTYITEEDMKEDSYKIIVESLYTIETENFMKGIFR